MIWFVYGEPRTGKSLFGGLVDAIIPALKRGRRVYTNIPLIRLGVCVECKISVMEYNRLVHPITCIQDIFLIYNQETQNIKSEYLDTVFVLDEFRGLRGLTSQTEQHLTKIFNVAGKSAVDFYLIAQLPSYFDAETRDLGEGCAWYERGDKRGKKQHSIEFLFDKKGGTPTRIGNRWDTEHYQYRYRNPKYFNMYHSYSMESEELMLERGEDHRVLVWWKTKSFKIFCIIVFFILVMISGGVYLLTSTTSTLNRFSEKKQKTESISKPLSTSQVSIPQKISLDNDDVEKICFEQVWVNDGIVTYKLNNGNYAYNPSYLIERCSRRLEWRDNKNR